MSAHEYQKAVIEYFGQKAAEYDLVDEQLYWALSDDLLWTCLERYVLDDLPAAPRILDAGGGTGRWSDRLLRHFPEATGLIYDLSAEMTEQARAKANARGYASRLDIELGDLSEIEARNHSGTFDLVLNFHNVLGFVSDPGDVLRQLVQTLRPGGRLCLFAPNLYHGVYFNLSIGNVPEAQRLLATGRGRFTDTMPDMQFFTGEGLKASLTEAGAAVEVCIGTPVFLYPGYAETQLRGSTAKLDDILSDAASRAGILELEKSVLGQSELAVRGNNLFVSAVRQ
ncbi:MAG: class I SAM-dependent methyltransferase [Angustibacter sp.]